MMSIYLFRALQEKMVNLGLPAQLASQDLEEPQEYPVSKD